MRTGARLTALLLAACLLLGLAGCGGGTETVVESDDGTAAGTQTVEATQFAAEEDYGYQVQVQDVDLGMEQLMGATLCGQTLYCCGATYEEETASYTYALTALALDGTVEGTVALPLSGEPWLQTVTVGDGCVWAVTSGPEETAEETAADETQWIYEDTEETTQTEADSSGSLLLRLDMDGRELGRTQLAQVTGEADFWPAAMAVDGAGDLLLAGDEVLLVYDAGLQLLLRTQVGSMISGLCCMPDGTVLILAYDADGQETLSFYDPEAGTVTEPLTLALPSTNYAYGACLSATGQVYLSSTVGLYRCDPDSGAMETVLEWLDYDLDENGVDSVAALEDGSFLLVGSDTLTGGWQTTLLERVPLSQLPEKIELTLGVTELTTLIRQIVLRFNRTSQDYRIVIKDYSEYNTDSDQTGWKTQMQLDMLTGDFPDILCTTAGSGLDLRSFARKGRLADLYALMGEDTVTKEDLVESYRTAMEVDGGLYTISSAFSVTTAVGLTERVGSEAGWSVETFAEAARNYTGDGDILWYNMTQESLLSYMLNDGQAAFVDWQAGTCRFDTEDFTELLELCLLLPEDYSYYDDIDKQAMAASGYRSIYERMSDENILLATFEIGSLDLSWQPEVGLPEGVSMVGIPGVGGNGAVIADESNIFAISAYTEYQDAAWDFVSTVLTEDYAAQYTYQLSVLETVLEEQLAEATEGEEGACLTQTQADALMETIRGAAEGYHYDADLTEIVLEEAAAFFAGQKDAETVAALIQDRAQTYLDEQG